MGRNVPAQSSRGQDSWDRPAGAEPICNKVAFVSGRERERHQKDDQGDGSNRPQRPGRTVSDRAVGPLPVSALATRGRAALNLRQRFPDRPSWGGTRGYIDRTANGEDTRDVLAQIERACPHVLVVGFGMPPQER